MQNHEKSLEEDGVTHVEATPPSQEQSSVLDLERAGEDNGYVVDLALLKTVDTQYQNVKLGKDGHTVLIPQPSDSPEDPLNWSSFKKHLFLIIISMTAFLPDYASAVGAVTLIPQSMIWQMSEDHVNHSQVGNVFMLGAGGIFIVAFSAYFGRLPVLFWFTFTALWTAAWCTAATSFKSFMAARILNGFFSTVAQSGGLMFIKDMFFFYEHARKINIWVAFILLSPYFGPLFSAFIITYKPWQDAFGLYTALTGFCLVLQILFMDETYYNRKLQSSERYPPQPRWKRIIGIEQWRSRSQRSTFSQAVMRPIRTILKPTVFGSTVYYLGTFAWVVGINTTLSIFLTPLYNFGTKQIGYFYFTPIVAALLGEVIGHWLHDIIARVLTRRNKSRFHPEYRLAVIWVAEPFIIVGLIVLGFALQRGWHYMLTSLGWGMYVFGIMTMTVGLQAYNLDSYPEASGEVAAWTNFGRTTGGFLASLFQIRWANAVSPAVSLGTQAAICFGFFLIIIFMQAFGRRLRRWSGLLDFKTD